MWLLGASLSAPRLFGPDDSTSDIGEWFPRNIDPGAFGVGVTDLGINRETFYNAETTHRSALTFDVSNNQITASLTRHGQVRNACIAAGIEQLPADKMKGGVYSTKRLRYSGPREVAIALNGIPLRQETKVRFVENVLPLFSSEQEGTTVHRLIFAPFDRLRGGMSPRSLILLVIVQNESSEAKTVTIEPELRWPAAAIDDAPENASSGQAHDIADNRDSRASLDFTRLRMRGRASVIGSGQVVSVSVPARSTESLCYAFTLGESKEESRQTLERLARKSLHTWLHDTLEARQSAYGQITIDEEPLLAASIARFGELARQSALRLSDGEVCGGFLGSDVDTNQVNWVRDSYYSMLGMSLFEPALCRDSIPYLMKWGKAPALTGPGRLRFPEAKPISQSLSNSLAGLCLAGAYYRATGDRDFFLSQSRFRSQAQTIFDDVLASRRGAVMLFPSLYFSDGEARGDFHTGSNVSAWFAFKSMSRIAEEIYRDDVAATEWQGIAQEIRNSIDSRCAGESSSGPRFYEGANFDGSFVSGHDGEESETTLMPFYGYCDSDDIRLCTHAALALSKDNPLYTKELDAIWWYNATWSSATFPSWITALSGSKDEAETKYRLKRIAQLIDLDGSVWWWPYRYGSKDATRPLRGDIAKKCGWGASVFLCKFINDVLGIACDFPASEVSFSPFMPWRKFHWQGVRLGISAFDVGYSSDHDGMKLFLVNRNSRPFTAILTLIPAKSEILENVVAKGGLLQSQEHVLRWSRPSHRVRVHLHPNESVEVSARKV